MNTHTNLDLLDDQNPDDILLQSLQYSTRALLGSFRDRTKSISQSANDIKTLLRQGYDLSVAQRAADKFFGKKNVFFVAIDGTESQDQQLEMLLFYSGAFAYVGQLEFEKVGCKCGEVVKAKELSNISAAIPLYEEDASNVIGKETQAGLEVEPERLPSVLMQFSEYYLAVKLIQENQDIKIVILDRTLAGDVGHLIWSVSEFIKENNCMLEGLSTDFGIVSSLDLELARILNPNMELGIPAPRSQFIKYAALNTLISTEKDGKSQHIQDYQMLLEKIGAESGRLGKLVNDITFFNQQYPFLENRPDNSVLTIKSQVGGYWDRVFAATMKIAGHIFDPPKGQHPLIYEESSALETINEDVAPTKIKKVDYLN